MKKFLINLLFRFYGNDYSVPLNKIQQEALMIKISTAQGLETFPAYLDQCITNARNKYLYTDDPIFKGSIMAYTFLKEEIAKNKPKPTKKDLTQEEKVGIIRRRGY